MFLSALPLSEEYGPVDEDSSALNGPHGNTLDNLYESLGRLIWTDTTEPHLDSRRLFNLPHVELKRPSKHDFVDSLARRLESFKDFDPRNTLMDKDDAKTYNPAGSGLNLIDSKGGFFLLNKRTPDNANVLMCLLCSKNTHLCDARQLVRACYPSGRTHRAE